jgi:hypothetical protein
MELSVLLNTSLQSLDNLCFTEHRLAEDQLVSLEIKKFKLVSKFCKKDCKNGGSCIFVNKELNTREVTFLNDLCCEKHFDICSCNCRVQVVNDRYLQIRS